MDGGLEDISQELPQSAVLGQIDSPLAVDHSALPAACTLCHRALSSDIGVGDLVAASICGDCKFLLLEDVETPLFETRRGIPRMRRTRNSSSESIENLFSQQFSHVINLARENALAVLEHENQSVDGDAAARLMQQNSSRTTPSGSRRWRRGHSDTESDSFDSLYGGSESNISFSGYRLFYGESDAISFSAYGGDSDASVDGHSILDNEMFAHPDFRNDLDSDTDIDPMHAGLSQWNSDQGEEEDEDEEDNEWEEADAEEDTVDSFGGGAQVQGSLSSSDNNVPVNWHSQLRSPDFESMIHWRIRERRRTYFPNMFGNLEQLEQLPYVWSDARGFEELLEHLAATDSLRRGAPPAAASFVKNLPCVSISEELEKLDGLACAICKDSLSAGNIAIQLPCSHLYHPSCILPWLTARNTCPLCRYELPTDDKDYEDRKQYTSSGLDGHEIQPSNMNEDSSSDDGDGANSVESCEYGHSQRELGDVVNVGEAVGSSGADRARGRWVFLAAAPIVSLMGIVLVLWFGNPVTGIREPIGRTQGDRHYNSRLGSLPRHQRENRIRRWWCLF